MRRLMCAAALWMLLPASSSSAGLLAVGTWPIDSSSPIMNLYSIDPSTGAATVVGSTGVARLQGITLGPSGNLLATNGPQLYSLNPLTGASTFVNSLPFNTIEGDLAARPGTNTVYMVHGGLGLNPEGLYSYDLTTNTGGRVGGFGLGANRDVSGAAFDASGVLHILHTGDTLPTANILIARVSLTTGAATNVLNTGIMSTGVAGMAFDNSGVGYFTNGSHLYRFDVAGGTTTLIGSHGLASGTLSGLAFVSDTAPIPEPSTLVLAMLGSIGAAAVRRRASRRAIPS